MAATAPPQPETPPVATVPTPETKGPIPFDRHEAALKNARTKTEAETTQRFQTQYAEHVAFGDKIQADPVGTLAGAISVISQDPVLGPQMISALARTLGAHRPPQPEADQEPQADFQGPDGTPFMSAPQQAKWAEWNRQQIFKEVDQRLQPFQQREQQHEARERYQAETQAADDRMSKVFAPYAEQPEFTANQPAIAAKVTELLAAGHDPSTALGLAYAHVLRETVLPSRAAQSQQTLVAQAVAKSTGSTTAPGTSPATPAARPQSMGEAFGAIQWT